MRVFISSNPKALKEKLTEFDRTATVEAEYGDTLVKGSVITLAHHGDRAGNPCPCIVANFVDAKVGAIGISHFDLDTLGGIMAIQGIKPDVSQKPECDLFWKLAAFVDMEGPHLAEEKVKELGSERLANNLLEWLHAWYAHSEENRIYAPRDGSVADVTDLIEKAQKAIVAVFQDKEVLLNKGYAWNERQKKINEDSFVEIRGRVIARISTNFVNAMYRTNDGFIGDAVVAFNPKTKAVTVSFAKSIENKSCKDIVQDLWGTEAGGRDTIAGSPRGRQMSLDEFCAAYKYTQQALHEY